MSTHISDERNEAGQIFLKHTLRLKSPHDVHHPNFRPEVELDFLDDTGASVMLIFRDDMQRLLGFSDPEIWPWDHILGYCVHNVANGASMTVLIIAVEVNILETDPVPSDRPVRFMKERWTSVACSVLHEWSWERPFGRAIRLNGPFLRTALYTGTSPQVPDSKVKIYITKTRSGLLGKNSKDKDGGTSKRILMPSLDTSNTVDPDCIRPYGWYKGHNVKREEEPLPFHPPESGPPGKTPWELKF
ncbi:hypothetical protein N7488_009142 [Penicillium malachiteum]|nr:hypothetical protein N7488_009142 [Penicillium malachiteum]